MRQLGITTLSVGVGNATRLSFDGQAKTGPLTWKARAREPHLSSTDFPTGPRTFIGADAHGTRRRTLDQVLEKVARHLPSHTERWPGVLRMHPGKNVESPAARGN